MQRINFYSADLMPARDRLDLRRALLIVPLALGLLSLITLYQRNALQQEQLATQKARDELHQVLADITRLSANTKDKTDQFDISTLQQQLQNQQALLSSLQQQGWAHNGYSQLLNELSLYAETSIWLTHISIDAHTLELKGATLTPEKIPDWMNRLQQQTVLSTIHFAQIQLQREDDKPILTFDVKGATP